MAALSTLLSFIPAPSLADLTATAQSHPLWRALGTNGIPGGVLFWLVATALQPLGRETTSVGMYARDPDQAAWLDVPLPARAGARPRTGWHSLPHRQIEQFPDDPAREAMVRAFAAYPEERPHAVDVARSPHERLHDAYVLPADVSSPHKVADNALREIAHVHDARDGSLHVVLAPRDCIAAIEARWCERHPLSGVFRPLPKNYLMIYAPRDEAEVEVVMRIVHASVGYMTGKRDV